MALTDNLVSYWKLDGNSNDSVASNNGTDTSITYSAGNGKIVQGAGFNGSTSKIELSTTAFGTTSTLSIAMWIKVTDTSVRQGIFCKTDGAGHSTTVFILEVGGTSGKISFGVSNGATTNTTTSATTVSNNTWTHIVATCDGTNQKIYINGSLDATSAYAGGAINNITMDTVLGQFGSYTLLPYSGAIDEPGFWSGKALDSTEVSQLYNGGAGLAYPFTSSTNATRLTLLNVS